ncbi:sucrose-phosphate synthase 4 isoform X2 [Magnolia sinica]|uniref:sucrose-phosphate synthase 4 isoform X2 n=1 Tax=Magnolia sinica TaxID=86752 RepID=UPI0026584570|nr:sucrose-phosphate synthase 4 isoform X2 [Magnolia sinica]
MAKNEWINGYLEAILDAGASNDNKKNNNNGFEERNSVSKEESFFKFSPTKYFVEEVVNSFDESDLHRTWIKVIATRNTRERNNRLENMCWRIWHLARKKKQIECDDSRRLAKRRQEREQGRNDAAEDLSELSEGEKEKGEASQADSLKTKIPRINSDMYMWSDEDNAKRLYIVLISLHGLVRGENMELGRDSDTGGQVKYVVELARALAATKGVYRVDLLTRQISSPDVDWSYGEPIEMLTRPSDLDTQLSGDSCGAYIIRLPCGPGDRYIHKELLWPHIPEFVDRALAHIVDMARALGDQIDGGRPIWPYVIHGHYADAGEVAARISGALNVPMVMTGHSLGRNKYEQLLKQGRLSKEDINSTYKIMRRIEAEELGLDAAEMVVTSTRQEIEEQWGLYDGFDLKLERKLRVRRRRGVSCLGRYMSRMVIMRFFTNPHKPMILALSRPDPKKNVTTLLKAFGECRPLRELANMTLILGNRDDIEEMSGSSSSVLTTVLKLIDKYDLYGQVAYPKHHKQSDVPQIYRLAAKAKGVFINPALVEPFGLTLIEAAAYGLPIVATKNGGPVDIVKALNNGLLIDPHDQKAIADALKKLVADKVLWLECRKNGLKNIHRFSWPEHCRNYLSHVEHCRSRHPTTRLELALKVEEPMSDSLRDVEDLSIRFSVDGDVKVNGDLDAVARQKAVIDALTQRRQRPDHMSAVNGGVNYCPGRRQRLFVIAVDCYDAEGTVAADELRVIIEKVMAAGQSDHAGRTGFVFSTGSTLAETLEALRSCHVAADDFDALICGSGSEVYCPWKDLAADVDYGAHVEYRWPGANVRSVIPRLAKIENGAEDDLSGNDEACTSRCYAYSIKPQAKVRRIDYLRQRLRMRGFRCNLVYTRASTRLNVLPLFASRAQALRYLSIRWGIDLSHMVTFVGDKGDTDHEEFLVGLQKTIVIKGSVAYGSEGLLRGEESYKKEDVVPIENPNTVSVEEEFVTDDISAALESVGMK